MKGVRRSGGRAGGGGGRRRSRPMPALRLRERGALTKMPLNAQENLDAHRWRAGAAPWKARPSWRPPARRAAAFPPCAICGACIAVGACRLCMVEVCGTGRLAPACTTPVQEGMSVIINSRQAGCLPPHDRWSCCWPSATTSAPSVFPTATASCSLWRRKWASPACASRTTIPSLAVDLSQPRYVLDHNRCILCSRCVRVCAEMEGAHVWDIMGRGIHSRIISRARPALGRSHHLHQLRQMRAGLSHRRAGRKGKAVEEMIKHPLHAFSREG